ncbi:MAG: potassium transporter Kup [Acidovorax sp.]
MPSSEANGAAEGSANNHRRGGHQHGLAALTLGAIGVVFGDIGTSPLYTVKEIFEPATHVPLDSLHIIGAVSVIFWALMLVVTLKYVILILRADNHGEGGGLALTALAASATHSRPRLRTTLLLLGVFGATLFYGDSVITPAISVLSAVEGVELITPGLKPYVIPISVVILFGLFVVQRKGTSVVGKLFGPIIVLWFVMLAVIGVVHIAQQPGILAALNPLYGLRFLADRGWHLFAAMGAIVLALTGGEALYADMGHFGRKPIQLAWSGLVLPALALNYMGQGAMLMGDPRTIESPFYRLFPASFVPAVVVLATLAAIIASQAVISGAYSMTKQAIQLGFLPRMKVKYTSAREAGQIYMPAVNWLLLAGVIAAVLGFKSSSALASAYGIAVTLTMLITTVLTFFVVRDGWRLPSPLALGATAFFIVIDVLLVSGCAVKFFDGGWFPLTLGLLLFVLMSTWKRGREILFDNIRKEGLELLPFIESLQGQGIHIAERTAVYMVADPTIVPPALLHNFKHNQVLHARNVLLNVTFSEVPWVPMNQRVKVEPLGHNFWHVTMHYGFMNVPDVPKALPLAATAGLKIDLFETSFFLSRATVISTPGDGMADWREKFFAAMYRNAGSMAEYFKLPGNNVVEFGERVEI